MKERVAQLKKDLSYPSPRTAARIMSDITGMIREAERRSALQFDMRPKARSSRNRIRVSRKTTRRRPTPLRRWTARARDLSDAAAPDQMTRFGLRTLVHHETVPGHHFQIGLMVENQSLPKFRQARLFGGISAITEGGPCMQRLPPNRAGMPTIPEPAGADGQGAWRARRLVVDRACMPSGGRANRRSITA